MPGLSKTLTGHYEVKTIFIIILKPYSSISLILYKCTEFKQLIDKISRFHIETNL